MPLLFIIIFCKLSIFYIENSRKEDRMAILENAQVKFSDLISGIETGQIKIPQFQRKFVWSVKQSAELLDSIIKGYPIGIFIYWRTNERLRSIRNLGNIKLPEPIEGEYIDYILDGQQRLTSLFASLKGATIKIENEKEMDYSKIYIDLAADEDDEIVITDKEGKNEKDIIALVDLLKGDIQLLASYPMIHHAKLSQYKQAIESFIFPVNQAKKCYQLT